MSWKLASTILNKRLPEGKLLLIALADHCFGDSVSCWPSIARLAEQCECSERALYRMLEKLKRLGYVSVERRQHKASVFTVHPDKMPDLKPDADDRSEHFSIDAGVRSEPLSIDAGDNSHLPILTLKGDRIGNCNKEKRKGFNRVEATGKPKSFCAPTLDEIRRYCEERHNSVDPEKFLAYYEANGWKVGRQSMKDWKAAVRYWERNNSDRNGNGRPSISERNREAAALYERQRKEAS